MDDDLLSHVLRSRGMNHPLAPFTGFVFLLLKIGLAVFFTVVAGAFAWLFWQTPRWLFWSGVIALIAAVPWQLAWMRKQRRAPGA
ncbi:hypothetical protein [Candidatus Accumulibacter vicinus]|jgi:hypothetical protein|uniref:Transmembrane protein n=1 Tax=Candidatus Accumulibacter vicinus TaxID=2954382 RepID=A0A084XUQ5_9PROT|nr:hypothetical protein [Candidatus Accumulibacter vicinus]KFB66199.1 MAG: hypothetical protein CAPSK01_004568 [Candidatus Accumulibacter vicinus]